MDEDDPTMVGGDDGTVVGEDDGEGVESSSGRMMVGGAVVDATHHFHRDTYPDHKGQECLEIPAPPLGDTLRARVFALPPCAVLN